MSQTNMSVSEFRDRFITAIVAVTDPYTQNPAATVEHKLVIANAVVSAAAHILREGLPQDTRPEVLTAYADALSLALKNELGLLRPENVTDYLKGLLTQSLSS